jgi:TRAP transporter TAXI family solute receptor
MPFRQSLRLAVGIMAGAISGCAAVSTDFTPAPVTLASGAPGGIYHPVGNAICRMFNLAGEHQERPCVAARSDGSMANIRGIRSGASAFGLSQTDVVYAAFRGEGPFAAGGPDRKLRVLIALYPEAFTVVARTEAGIREFRDLNGRRFGLERSGSGHAFTRDVVLQSYGWAKSESETARELEPAELTQALCSGTVDAIVFEVGHPNGLVQEATNSCRATLVSVAGPPIDRLLAMHPYYAPIVLPGGLYAGNPDDVPTFGTRAMLVSTADQPDALAYAVVKAVFENFADFRRLHPALATLDIKRMVPSEGLIPIHPGALAYFREAGLVP